MSDTNITQPEVMTGAQDRKIRRFLVDGLDAVDLEVFSFTTEEAQEIIEKGDLIENEIKDMIATILKKYAIIDQRYGPALAEFDVIVPMDYNHDTYIDQIGKEVNKLKNTYYYNDALTSKNFAKATNKLVPGKTYRAKIYPILATVTSEDNMNFLKRQRAMLVGVQGLFLAQSQHKDKFPVDKWTVSFDEKEALWEQPDGKHGVPRIDHNSDDEWRFHVGDFEYQWNTESGNCLLCFWDK